MATSLQKKLLFADWLHKNPRVQRESRQNPSRCPDVQMSRSSLRALPEPSSDTRIVASRDEKTKTRSTDASAPSAAEGRRSRQKPAHFSPKTSISSSVLDSALHTSFMLRSPSSSSSASASPLGSCETDIPAENGRNTEPSEREPESEMRPRPESEPEPSAEAARALDSDSVQRVEYQQPAVLQQGTATSKERTATAGVVNSGVVAADGGIPIGGSQGLCWTKRMLQVCC